MTNPKYLYVCVRSFRTYNGKPITRGPIHAREVWRDDEEIVASGSYEAMEAASLLLNDCCEMEAAP